MMWDTSRSKMDVGLVNGQKVPQGMVGTTKRSLEVVGLFAGIGGFEEGFRRAGHGAILLCESDKSASRVLEARFRGARLSDDVRALVQLPTCDVLTAGFPCQDLSQVGRRRGISGPDSRLVEKVFALLRGAQKVPQWLILENVPFMLKLDRGAAIRTITNSLESMGWSWAYRVVNTRSFGLPQRRRRVILVASKRNDPRPALLGEDIGVPDAASRGNHACGFYWTEGNTGLGWAENSIPPLKGGSGLHIPSPPAVWFPRRRAIFMPNIRDAERLQGFDADWTEAAIDERHGDRKRWRLVGNAVSVPVAEWIAGRLGTRSAYDAALDGELRIDSPWPDAAWGVQGVRRQSKVSDWPIERPQAHLSAFLRYPMTPLTEKATRGFLSRLENSSLRYDDAFGRDLRHHLKFTRRQVRSRAPTM
jgi:DNA (cytosine-5)-methyltransferase 1